MLQFTFFFVPFSFVLFVLQKYVTSKNVDIGGRAGGGRKSRKLRLNSTVKYTKQLQKSSLEIYIVLENLKGLDEFFFFFTFFPFFPHFHFLSGCNVEMNI